MGSSNWLVETRIVAWGSDTIKKTENRMHNQLSTSMSALSASPSNRESGAFAADDDDDDADDEDEEEEEDGVLAAEAPAKAPLVVIVDESPSCRNRSRRPATGGRCARAREG